jgi:signal peptidase I
MVSLGRGGSMVPWLRQGDAVTVVPAARCRVGDVILYSRGEVLVMHRVVGKIGGRIIAKGDAVGRLDPPITPQDIIGLAVSIKRHGKKRSLDSLGSRLGGLAFSLTVSWIPKSLPFLAAVKRLGREKLGLGGPFRD